MNDLQALFTIVFGIYFATSVSASGKFYPFDSSAIVTGDRRAALRLLLSFVLLDPFVYFMVVLRSLSSFSSIKVADAWLPTLGVLFAALGGFAFYRFFVAAMTLRRMGAQARFIFYSHPDELRGSANKYASHREPPPDTIYVPPGHVFVGGLMWLVICISTFYVFI